MKKNLALSHKKFYLEKQNFECPITWEILNLNNSTITHCNHVFENDALENWLKKSKKCPYCKSDLNTKDSSNNTHPQLQQNTIDDEFFTNEQFFILSSLHTFIKSNSNKIYPNSTRTPLSNNRIYPIEVFETAINYGAIENRSKEQILTTLTQNQIKLWDYNFYLRMRHLQNESPLTEIRNTAQNNSCCTIC